MVNHFLFQIITTEIHRAPVADMEKFAWPGIQIIEKNGKNIDSPQLAILCSKNKNKSKHE